MRISDGMIDAAVKTLASIDDPFDWLSAEDQRDLMRKTLTDALAVQTQQGVEKLGWHKPDKRNSLSRAENDLGVYRVWTHFEANGRWFWSLDGYQKVSGECASEDEAKAAAQSDYETRIRSALVDVPAVESEPVEEPEPVAWYMHLWNEADEYIKSDVRWGRPTAEDIARAEHNGHETEYLYAHPPRSSLIQSEEVEIAKLTRPIVGIEHRTALEVFDIMADRIRLALSTPPSPYGGDNGGGSATGTTGASALRNMGGGENES